MRILLVVLGDQEQRAVVLALAADLPGVGDADRIRLDRLRLRSSARSARRAGWPCAPPSRRASPRAPAARCADSVCGPIGDPRGQRRDRPQPVRAGRADARPVRQRRGDEQRRDQAGERRTRRGARLTAGSTGECHAVTAPACGDVGASVRRCGRRCRPPAALLEIDLRRRADRRLVGDGEVRLHVHLEHHRRQVGRELTAPSCCTPARALM